MFTLFGALFLFTVLAVEYFLWLGPTGRLILLIALLGVEVFLLFRYIVIPCIYLFKVREGISNRDASVIIGKHFPEVGDKLLNLLDLAEDDSKTELLIASIEQRSRGLQPIPFAKAINLRENLKYARYLVAPALILVLIWMSGNLRSFFGSYERVVNYSTAYEPPAPFIFKLLSASDSILETEEYVIQVVTEGEVQPEDVHIVVNGREFLMQKENEFYQFTFSPPIKSSEFYFQGNDVQSRVYSLEALKAPSIQDFKLVLDFPDYTKRKQQIIKGTGNATIPEGTRVSWEINGLNTSEILLKEKDTALRFKKDEDQFRLSKFVYSNLTYQLSTSNEHVKAYENLDYRFNVIRDAYPTIEVDQVLDSLNPNVSYYVGQVSDDYEIDRIELVYYDERDEKNKQRLLLSSPGKNFNQFYYTFPTGLELEDGKRYLFYFEATDNDAIRKGKKSKSKVFNRAILDDNELKNRELEVQEKLIKNMDRSLDNLKEQKKALKEINKEQKEKTSLNFNDQSQVRDFLRKQQRQERLMEKFSRKLKENLNKVETDDEMNKLLRERLERQEIEAKKNEKLLEELNKIADKIEKEELAKRLEELAKKQQNSERSLEQLLELTKRYYVTEKAAQLALELEKLAEKQNELAETKIDSLTKQDQQNANEQFEQLSKELRELEKDNSKLKKPLKLGTDQTKEEDIKKEQNEALERLEEHQRSQEDLEKQESGDNARKKQKSAAQKMQQLSDALKQSSSGGGGGSTITEDAEMLRQILDNLVTFSLKQEKLYDSLDGASLDVSSFSGTVREQRRLRELFEHVDDSLFSLSLRRVELSEFVNEQITEVYYNIDKSLESIAENQIYQGVSYQQYVLNASNSLADFLANILDNMQQSLSQSSGSGSSEDGFQLPDIIKSQGELQEKMSEMGQSGKEGSRGEQSKGESGQKGEQGKGQEGKEGEGQDGQKGSDGKEGQGEQGEGEGGNGRDGDKDGISGSGEGQMSEEELKEIYEIYKEQQMIREQLEQQLEDLINARDKQLAQKLIRQMEEFENQLLENGITERTISKMNTIQHQLLKLENAALKQGKKLERESNTNREIFRNPVLTKPELLKNNGREIEILNRQALPLQRIFRDKVKDYFKTEDD